MEPDGIMSSALNEPHEHQNNEKKVIIKKWIIIDPSCVLGIFDRVTLNDEKAPSLGLEE